MELKRNLCLVFGLIAAALWASDNAVPPMALEFYPAKFQRNTMHLVADMPQTLLGDIYAEPADAAKMMLEIDLPEDIRFIGSSPWWGNAKKEFLPDPVTRSSIEREGRKYNRYTVKLEEKLLQMVRRKSKVWSNTQRVFISAKTSTQDGVGYFRLISPCAGTSEEIAIQFKVLPPLKEFEPTKRFMLGITALQNLTAPFPEVRETSLKLLFSLSQRPLTGKLFFWKSLPEELRRDINDRTYFITYFYDNGLPNWRKKNNWQVYRMDEGTGPISEICPTYAAEEYDSPYWQQYVLASLRSTISQAHRVDCIGWDLEPMKVCRCSLCRDRFSKELKLDHIAAVDEVKGKYSAEYFQFRVRQNGRVARNFARLVKENFPTSHVSIITDNLHAAPPHVAAWCGVDVRQFDDAFDIMHNMIYYSGLTYFDDFAFNMKTLKTPQAPWTDPAENLERFYIRYTPPLLHMNIVATAALGGQGFSIYPSEILDGAYYPFLQKSVSAVSRAEDYYAQRGEPVSTVPKNVHVITQEKDGKTISASIPDLKSVLRALSHEIPGKGKLLTLFNYSSKERMILEIPAQGAFRAVRDIETGERYQGVDGTQPFLVALEPQSVKLLELSASELPLDGEKCVLQAKLREELLPFLDNDVFTKVRPQQAGNYRAGWGVEISGKAVAELSDGISTIGVSTRRNGSIISWRRGSKDIVSDASRVGRLDEWLFIPDTVEETIDWEVTGFAASPEHAEMTLEAELPPPRNAAPNVVSLQGVKLKRTIILRNGELLCKGEIFNPKPYPVSFSFRSKNYPQIQGPWTILSGNERYNQPGSVTFAQRNGRQLPIPGRCLNDQYDGTPFVITTPNGSLSIHAPAADGVLVWNSENAASTVEPCFTPPALPHGKIFSLETRYAWRQ
ncbi:MAG: hypothetical protein IJJ33_06010 [Victivallales bacterium]|nr:hypothetical protein [Victivallales bacterium]